MLDWENLTWSHQSKTKILITEAKTHFSFICVRASPFLRVERFENTFCPSVVAEFSANTTRYWETIAAARKFWEQFGLEQRSKTNSLRAAFLVDVVAEPHCAKQWRFPSFTPLWFSPSQCVEFNLIRGWNPRDYAARRFCTSGGVTRCCLVAASEHEWVLRRTQRLLHFAQLVAQVYQ